jgi:hypothetical protein
MQTMKPALILSLSLLLFSCSKDIDNPTDTPPATVTTLKQGLLLYMPFNGSLADSSGYPVTGIGFGATAYAGNRYFEEGKALALNGVNNRIEIPTQVLDTVRNFTIYMEFLPDNTSSMTLLSRTMFSVTANMKQTFNLMSNFGGGGTRFRMKKAGNCDNTNTATAFGTEVLGQAIPSIKAWNYVAVTYNGATIQMYLNGILVGSGPEPGAGLCSGAPLIIGSWYEGEPHYFKGRIDELRIYNRVLSTSEITQINQLHN